MPYLNLLYFLVFLQIMTCLILKSTSVLMNVNTWITITAWAVFIYLARHFDNALFLLGPIILLALNEILYANFNIDGFDGESRTKLFYDLTTTYFINNSNQNTNLTEGIYLKDLDDNESLMNEREAKELAPDKANKNKYDKFFVYLNIEPHEYKHLRILDMGCGNGDFIKYCNSLGIQTSGMTISSEQVDALKKQNLDVHLGSYRDLQPQFIGKYDIVTFWGSLEHITQSYPCSKSGEKKADEEIKNAISYAKQYYHPDSTYKLLFNTTLHMNKKVCEGTLNAYFVERAYGGWYFYDEPGQTISDKMESIGFEKLKQDDFTYHYYMASKIDPSHFGSPAKLSAYYVLALLFGVFINPNIIAMALYNLRGEWMWQFDNKLHYFDTDCESCSIVERSVRPTTLLWGLCKYNNYNEKRMESLSNV
jgi:cyclopropane fatty-acyl-phospholipid synthase-like methyltransferase